MMRIVHKHQCPASTKEMLSRMKMKKPTVTSYQVWMWHFSIISDLNTTVELDDAVDTVFAICIYRTLP